MSTKRESAKKINDIQGRVQDVYFDLEEFHDIDIGNAAKSKTIELMDDIASIRKRILQSDENNNS